jgi:hypothetical protein
VLVSHDLSGILKTVPMLKYSGKQNLIQNSEWCLLTILKYKYKKIEDYDLALKQDLVYNQAVEQASENYRI